MSDTPSGTSLPERERGGSILHKGCALPDRVFAALPPTLYDLCAYFEGTDRSVFLMGAIPVLGGIASPGVSVYVYDRPYSTDLYTCIVAPPSSGKGALSWARRLGRLAHEAQRDASQRERAAFHELKPNDRKGLPEPAPRGFFVPANSGATRFVEIVKASGEQGVVFEEEIDTLAATAGQDWGDYTDVLRKAWHHEPVSIARADRFLDLERLRLSVCLSGTPGQFARFMQSAENGLFSRFLYLPFVGASTWRSQRPTQHEEARIKAFDAAARRYANLHDRLLGRMDRPVRARLTTEQWEEHDAYFGGALARLLSDGHDDVLVSSVKRGGVAALRMAALLTALRLDDAGHALEEANVIHVTNEDFLTALDIAAVGVTNATILYALLTGQDDVPEPGAGIKAAPALARLPHTFGREDILRVASELGISDRTIERARDGWIKDGLVERAPGAGRYRKTAAPEPEPLLPEPPREVAAPSARAPDRPTSTPSRWGGPLHRHGTPTAPATRTLAADTP